MGTCPHPREKQIQHQPAGKRGLSVSEKHKDPAPVGRAEIAKGEADFPRVGPPASGSRRGTCAFSRARGAGRRPRRPRAPVPTGDAPLSPAQNKYSRAPIQKRKAISDLSQERPEPGHPAEPTPLHQQGKIQTLRGQSESSRSLRGKSQSHDTAAITRHFHPLLKQLSVQKTLSRLLPGMC